MGALLGQPRRAERARSDRELYGSDVMATVDPPAPRWPSFGSIAVGLSVLAQTAVPPARC